MGFRKKATKAPEGFHFGHMTGGTGWGDEMRNLAQEITNSFDARVAGVANLRHETAAKLNRFRQEMRRVHNEFRRKAAELKRFLFNDAQMRSRRNGAMMAGFRQEHHAAAGHWRSMAAALAKKRTSFAR